MTYNLKVTFTVKIQSTNFHHAISTMREWLYDILNDRFAFRDLTITGNDPREKMISDITSVLLNSFAQGPEITAEKIVDTFCVFKESND